MKKNKNGNDEIHTAKLMPRRVEKVSGGIVKSEKDLESIVENFLEVDALHVAWGETKDHRTITAGVMIKPNVMVTAARMARLAVALNATVCIGPIDEKGMLLGLAW